MPNPFADFNSKARAVFHASSPAVGSLVCSWGEERVYQPAVASVYHAHVKLAAFHKLRGAGKRLYCILYVLLVHFLNAYSVRTDKCGGSLRVSTSRIEGIGHGSGVVELNRCDGAVTPYCKGHLRQGRLKVWIVKREGARGALSFMFFCLNREFRPLFCQPR